MKFVIRDDDLNYFSTPADIERWYQRIFSAGIPVGFSSIPFVTPSSDVYPFYPPETAIQVENKEYPIGDNNELVAYIKANPHIEILQHGTTHKTEAGVFEYARKISRTETIRGRKHLEHTFDTTVDIFVPPHDWIGESGIHSVEAAGMNIIRGRGAGLRNLILRFRYLLNFIRMFLFKVRHALSGAIPPYPFVLDFGRHKEVCSYRLEDIDVFTGLTYAHRKKGVFVVVTHLHFFNKEKEDRLLQLIQKARELGAEFVPPSRLFK